MRGAREAMDRPVSMRKVLKGLLGKGKESVPRWLLSGRASRRLKEVHDRTGISMEVLSDAAIDAVHAALSGSMTPVKIRDQRLRAWLQAQKHDEEEQVGEEK